MANLEAAISLGAEVVEPRTGVSFPCTVADGKQLKALGVRKKTVLGLGIKINAFGIYADDEKLRKLMRSKIGKAPAKPTKEMYQAVIDSDTELLVRAIIVYRHLTMALVRKNFGEGLGASIKKLNRGQTNNQLSAKVMEASSDNINLEAGSLIEDTRFPGYSLETKIKGEAVSKIQSELLCRAYINMYLGDEPFDKEAKEKFGAHLLSLF